MLPVLTAEIIRKAAESIDASYAPNSPAGGGRNCPSVTVTDWIQAIRLGAALVREVSVAYEGQVPAHPLNTLIHLVTDQSITDVNVSADHRFFWTNVPFDE